jgi:putative membrane protein
MMERDPLPQVPADVDELSLELSSRRTGMSFQRTRMSADRTLMSVIRTSLSLIGFGFTIYQIIHQLAQAQQLHSTAPARHFGLALVSLGVGMLVVGMGYHLVFMIGLRSERHALVQQGLVHGESRFPPSLTLMVALLLLVIGLLAIGSLAFRMGPFHESDDPPSAPDSSQESDQLSGSASLHFVTSPPSAGGITATRRSPDAHPPAPVHRAGLYPGARDAAARRRA